MTLAAAHPVPVGLDPQFLELLIQEHETTALPRLERLWDYYRNDTSDAEDSGSAGGADDRPYHLAQEQGLPARLTGLTADGAGLRPAGVGRREIVIENDIGWRVHALVDFMFGKSVVLQSCAPDPARATLLETFLRRVIEASGGVAFFQDLALLGSVYGYADVLVRVRDEDRPGPGREPTLGELPELARRIVLETIEAPRAIPVLNPDDYRHLDAYVLHYRQALNELGEGSELSFLSRLRSSLGGAVAAAQRATRVCTQVWTDRAFASYQAPGAIGTTGQAGPRRLIQERINRLGRVPVVHIQNLPQPFFYEGLSEVEPLIPLQDELNIRLSDRANRVTFQSFKMYLGRGIEGFVQRPVGPGQMWATENPDASIQEFGGDADSPSEDAHVGEIRQAMDKTSAVSAIAAGLLRDRVGNLTSENALRIVMMGLLAKTERKRVTYGAGLERLCELVLHAADVFGLLPNRPEERGVRLEWPSPLPEDGSQRLRDAKLKLELGVPRKQVLAELGYEVGVE